MVYPRDYNTGDFTNKAAIQQQIFPNGHHRQHIERRKNIQQHTDMQQENQDPIFENTNHKRRMPLSKTIVQYIGWLIHWIFIAGQKIRLFFTEYITSRFCRLRKETINMKQLKCCYRLLQADLKRLKVPFIQTVYKDHERGKIVVDVMKGNGNTYEELLNLQSNEEYGKYLEIRECDAGEFLMQGSYLSNLANDLPYTGHPQYNVRIGSGSLIGCISIHDEELQELIKDKNMKSIDDIWKKYASTSTGTLTCIVKHGDNYYTMTAQHVLDKEQFSSNQKQIFSQVHYDCPALLLADIVHIASRYSGQMDTISVNGLEKAVDVALMPMSQSHVDVALLERLTVYYRAVLEGATQDTDIVLMDKPVRKKGAITGETEGVIISTDCLAPLYPGRGDSPQGEMFAVASNTTQPFAQEGDSGSLVTIELNHSGKTREYALGIIAQRRQEFSGRENVTLCVYMEDCLTALESATGLDERIDSSALELYEGFLRPFAALHDRKMAHVEVDST